MAALFAPSIPGMSSDSSMPPAPGESPLSGGGPLSALAALLGGRPKQGTNTTGDKMAQVVQLLREISREDPRIGALTSEALRVLIEGGTSSMIPRAPMGAPMAGQGPGPMASMMGGAGGGVPPMGSPGGMIV